MAKDSLRSRQAELDAFAHRNGWRRGPFKSWTKGRLTIGVASSGWPRAKFVATVRRTAQRREFDKIEDLGRFADYVNVTGQVPAESA